MISILFGAHATNFWSETKPYLAKHMRNKENKIPNNKITLILSILILISVEDLEEKNTGCFF